VPIGLVEFLSGVKHLRWLYARVGGPEDWSAWRLLLFPARPAFAALRLAGVGGLDAGLFVRPNAPAWRSGWAQCRACHRPRAARTCLSGWMRPGDGCRTALRPDAPSSTSSGVACRRQWRASDRDRLGASKADCLDATPCHRLREAVSGSTTQDPWRSTPVTARSESRTTKSAVAPRASPLQGRPNARAGLIDA
jgi:hypothetical protein